MIIGHGAGRAVLLKLLEEKLREIKGAFLLSGKPLSKDFEDFNIDELEMKHITEKTKNFFIYATENDDEESIKESEKIAQLLRDEVLIFDNKKNFDDDEKIEDLLIDILSLTN
jgi:predicted alpha/beta hydrolase family esterase